VSEKKLAKTKYTLPLPEPETREAHDLFISAEPAEIKEAADANVAADLANEQVFKTQDGDGHQQFQIQEI
jgi:hypothetical protein